MEAGANDLLTHSPHLSFAQNDGTLSGRDCLLNFDLLFRDDPGQVRMYRKSRACPILPADSSLPLYATDSILAEREGFEPSIEFPLYTLSKRAPSTTRPSLRGVEERFCAGRNARDNSV